MDKKILNNATLCYLFMGYFMLKKVWNERINNDFVRWHAKSAVFINSLMILSYFIFISLWFLSKLYILWIWLNHIIASILIIWLFITSFIWMYKAQKWEEFNITYKTAKTTDISFIKAKINEEQKTKLIIALIPLIWKLLVKNDNSWIIHNKKIAWLAYFIIGLLVILSMNNSLLIFSLIYLIFLVFVALTLFLREELFIFWKKIPSISEINKYFFTSIKYFFFILIWRFKKFDELMEEQNENISEKYEKDIPLKYLSYIPFINIILIKSLKTKQRNHIISGLILTIILTIIYLLDWINSPYQIIILYFIFLWFENINDENYKMPFIYHKINFKKKPTSKS